jgi:hypothetical protein
VGILCRKLMDISGVRSVKEETLTSYREEVYLIREVQTLCRHPIPLMLLPACGGRRVAGIMDVHLDEGGWHCLVSAVGRGWSKRMHRLACDRSTSIEG